MKVQVDDMVIETKKYMGKKYLDIRKFFHDTDSGEVKPTKKGITFNKKNFTEVLKALNDNKAEIESHLGGK